MKASVSLCTLVLLSAGQRRFLTALAIETVLMILNSAHYK